MTKIEIELDSIKMTREALCLAEAAMNRADMNIAESAVKRIGKLIKQLDKHRPIGQNGKHGEQHTDTCGCKDK